MLCFLHRIALFIVLWQPDEQSRRFNYARKMMSQFATKLIEQERSMIPESYGKQPMQRRKGNFLSLVVKANMSSDEGQRISDRTMIDGMSPPHFEHTTF